jgi:hypothetical protein
MKFEFTYFLLQILRYYYYFIFPGFSHIQLKKLKYVVDRGILWKFEVAHDQQKSAQACCAVMLIPRKFSGMVAMRMWCVSICVCVCA